ncbi:MAG: purine-binding chemotaxis protein CheW [Oscillospiraceae bacterium]|nr:purine-binding chemotaxis protein CheW [Oscillospiraceae bacterium]
MDEIILEKNNAADDLNGRFLTFYIDDTVYGIDLLHVIEIIQVPPITHIPHVPNYIKGIINLRGKIAPIISVRLKFNQQEIPYDEKTCIIVVVINDMHVGLIVDSISEVANIDSDELAAPPQFGSDLSNQYLGSIANVDGRVILNIDCNKFFESDLGIISSY